MKALSDVVIRLKNGLRKTFQAEGFNIAWNEGKMAGQAIDHLHIHVVPRKTGDAGIYEYEPRKFLYRPGSRNESPRQELQEVAELIKKSLALTVRHSVSNIVEHIVSTDKIMLEIEIKLRVEDLEGLAKQLEARGCILSALISQHDIIYSKGGNGDEWANPKEGNIIIRIRRSQNKSELTLKQTAKLHKQARL